MPEEITEGLDKQDETAEGDATEEQETAEETGVETEEKFEESPEDVRKARAFHQTEDQKSKAELKVERERTEQLESEVSGLNEELNNVIGEFEAGMAAPPTAAAVEEVAPAEGDDQYLAELKKMNQRMDRMEQNGQNAEQHKINERYKDEIAKVGKVLVAVVNRAVGDERVTKEQVQEAADYARSIVGEKEYSTQLGGPSRRAKVFADKLRLLELEGEKAIKKAPRGTHADKAKMMEATSQPDPGAIPAPTKAEQKSQNEQRADQVVPDDEDVVPIPNS